MRGLPEKRLMEPILQKRATWADPSCSIKFLSQIHDLLGNIQGKQCIDFPPHPINKACAQLAVYNINKSQQWEEGVEEAYSVHCN